MYAALDFDTCPRPQNIVSFLRKQQPINILVVARETNFTNQFRDELSYLGHCVKFTQNSEHSWKASSSYYSLVVIDWTLSPISGLEFCQRLRSINKNIPIIVLVEPGQVENCIAALDAGADDCIATASNMPEIIARVRARLRPDREKKSHIIYYSNLILNQKTREVYLDGVPIGFTAREFELLAYFMRYPHQVLTHTQILEAVWGYDFVGVSNVIEVYVRYLRLKLEANDQKRLIHTVRSVGYVLRV